MRDIVDASRAAESGDMAAFTRAFQNLHLRVTTEATSRGEGTYLGLEVALLRLDPFFWARTLYLLAFLVVAATGTPASSCTRKLPPPNPAPNQCICQTW